jgi:integrase
MPALRSLVVPKETGEAAAVREVRKPVLGSKADEASQGQTEGASSMSKKVWVGDGIYYRERQRKLDDPLKVYFGQVWIKGQKRFRHFRLATSLRQAKKKMATIYGDPEKAVAERQQRLIRVPTFGEVLGEFLDKYCSRGGTDYYSHVTKRLKEHFKSKPVTAITSQSLDRYLQMRRDETNGDGRRRVGESTLRKEIIALGTVFRWARRRGFVVENPVLDYDKPKEPSDRSIAILSLEQETALKAACPAWAWDVIEWALYSGMRRGEILSLRWRDIDQERGVIHTGSKTQRSARTVPLNVSSRLAAILERRPRHIGSDQVFCERDGGRLDLDVINRVVEAAAKTVGIAKHRGVMWNRFRHSWATRLAATGKVSLFEISKWMGNSVAVCERHYAAYLPGSHEKSAGLLDGPAPERRQTVPPAVPDRQKDSIGEASQPYVAVVG